MQHFERYGKMYLLGVAVLASLGIGFNIELPADAEQNTKIEEVRTDVAQLYGQYESEWKTRSIRDKQETVESIDHKMRFIEYQISEINAITERWNQELTPEEEWQLERLKGEWELLRERRNELTSN